MYLIPRSAGQVVLEMVKTPLYRGRICQNQTRRSGAHLRTQERLGASEKCLTESVCAVAGNRHHVDTDLRAALSKDVRDPVKRWKSGLATAIASGMYSASQKCFSAETSIVSTTTGPRLTRRNSRRP